MTRFKITREAVWRESAGEVIAVDARQGVYVGANSTGALLWRRLVDGAERDELVQALLDAHDGLDAEQAGRDVDAFLEALSANGLLEP
jgi:Coenzyme PQQ synthesis protein D (PqqD)